MIKNRTNLTVVFPLVLIAGIVAFLLSGCSALTASVPITNPTTVLRNCPPAAALAPVPGSIKASTPTVVYLASPGVKPAPADISTVLAGATNERADLYVGGISASTPPATSVVLKADGDNDTDRGTNLACKTQLVQTSLSDVTKSTKTSSVDVFDALLNVSGALTGVQSTKVDVVLDGDVVNNTSGINLSKVTKTNITQTVNQVSAAGLLPSCKGWRITVVSPVNPLLRDFYNQLFAHCGGTLVAWTPSLSTFPVTTGRLALTDYSQIPIQRVPGKIVATLAGDVTFDTGQAALQPGAEEGLEQVLALVPPGNGPIVVDGFTDDTGTDAINGPLSAARAQTIRTWLISRGVAANRVSAHGLGSSSPAVKGDSAAARAADRRVTVTIYTPTAS